MHGSKGHEYCGPLYLVVPSLRPIFREKVVHKRLEKLSIFESSVVGTWWWFDGPQSPCSGCIVKVEAAAPAANYKRITLVVNYWPAIVAEHSNLIQILSARALQHPNRPSTFPLSAPFFIHTNNLKGEFCLSDFDKKTLGQNAGKYFHVQP